jgi:DNA-binding transcriptional LysR family regulator
MAVAETGGLTPAAETLNVSLPAISRRLTGLEDELGIHLLERGAHAVWR